MSRMLTRQLLRAAVELLPGQVLQQSFLGVHGGIKKLFKACGVLRGRTWPELRMQGCAPSLQQLGTKVPHRGQGSLHAVRLGTVAERVQIARMRLRTSDAILQISSWQKEKKESWTVEILPCLEYLC